MSWVLVPGVHSALARLGAGAYCLVEPNNVYMLVRPSGTVLWLRSIAHLPACLHERHHSEVLKCLYTSCMYGTVVKEPFDASGLIIVVPVSGDHERSSVPEVDDSYWSIDVTCV